MNKFTFLTPKNAPSAAFGIFSPYDTIESLNFQAQKIFSLISQFANPPYAVSKLIKEVNEEISKLITTCEEALDQKRYLTSLNSKSSLKERSDSINPANKEMDQPEADYEDRLQSLEGQLKKSEEARQRVHVFHQDCLSQIDHDIDELLHDYKQKYKPAHQVGNILEELFSNEELEQERRVALGNVRESVEIKIKKLDESKGEKWDMNLDSEESSGPPPDLEGTGLILYDRLHDLKVKLCKLRHEDLENLAPKENSLDQGFLGSLPCSMQSISGTNSVKLDQMLTSLDQSIDKNEMDFDFRDQLLTLDEKENFIMTLIEKEGTTGQDVRLEDILSIEDSEKKNSQIENSISFFEHSSKLQITTDDHKELAKNDLENSKPDLDIRLSPISTPKKASGKKGMIENLSQESSIIMNENNTSSFISENSFLNEERRKFKAPKRSEKSMLRRPKISDHDDSNSSIFPPINTSSDDQSFRLPSEKKVLRRLPLVPSKPMCAPPKDRFNLRGRSLLPIHSSIGNSPKVMIIQDNSMNKSSSPNTVNSLRMRRYKEIMRPFEKYLGNKLVPKEPIGFSYNNGVF